MEDSWLITELSAQELRQATQVGTERCIASMIAGHQDKHGAKRNWHLDILGATGELALAKVLQVYWPATVNNYKAPDVGKVQVRTIDKAGNSLIIRFTDADDEPFALVLSHSLSRFEVLGWVWARDAKAHEGWRRDPDHRGTAWFVPQDELQPVNTELIGLAAGD